MKVSGLMITKLPGNSPIVGRGRNSLAMLVQALRARDTSRYVTINNVVYAGEAIIY